MSLIVSEVILNPNKFDMLIPIKLQNIIKLKSIGSFDNLSRKYSKKLACFSNSFLSQDISNLHFIEVTNKFRNDFFRDTNKNDPIKLIEVININADL